MAKLRIFLSESFNPYLNLATEEWIFHHMQPDAQVLFLWRNQDTVVIGRTQNPWNECNLEKMKNENVHLARRTTGGGAVFHDLGNTNFTFMSPKDHYSRENNIKIITEALANFGIQSEASGRNDLLLMAEDGPRKFSGSAYREKKDRAFHHGTLLINADLGRLSQYLTPNPKKIQAKGKESVRARVANLVDINKNLNHDIVSKAIMDSFEKFYQGSADFKILNSTTLEEIQMLKNQYDELSSRDWLYNRTLDFTQRIDDYLSLGFFDFQFKVSEGHIKDLEIFSDCLYPSLIDDLKTSLMNKEYSSQSVLMSFTLFSQKYLSISDGLSELQNWLVQKIEI